MGIENQDIVWDDIEPSTLHRMQNIKAEHGQCRIDFTAAEWDTEMIHYSQGDYESEPFITREQVLNLSPV